MVDVQPEKGLVDIGLDTAACHPTEGERIPLGIENTCLTVSIQTTTDSKILWVRLSGTRECSFTTSSLAIA
ncbi:hypothetical protein FOMPIDRAFT_1023604 [Fomitopsis schrenkii]|uniref:Uncharacterized protein n=1 Tax=Fomitopsis schrenkii TaxID=2126942 RepID=S8FRJ5_FOMSC|nr:hypothetical protein FOMPIDRAFT_1023604 [Fomitopsis schrenkii]